jgi:hypothetical protein
MVDWVKYIKAEPYGAEILLGYHQDGEDQEPTSSERLVEIQGKLITNERFRALLYLAEGQCIFYCGGYSPYSALYGSVSVRPQKKWLHYWSEKVSGW